MFADPAFRTTQRGESPREVGISIPSSTETNGSLRDRRRVVPDEAVREEVPHGDYGGILGTTIALPLDFCKSRMQSYDTGFVAIIRDAYKAEGLPTLLGVPYATVQGFNCVLTKFRNSGSLVEADQQGTCTESWSADRPASTSLALGVPYATMQGFQCLTGT